MTKLFTILFLIFNLQTPQQPEINNIENSTIKIVNSAGGSFAWGTRDELQRAFGKAKTVTEPDEVLGGTGDDYRYKGLTVYFHTKDCESMDVRGPEFKVTLNGKMFKVGDHIAKLQATFPASYKARREGMIGMGIANKKVLTDAYVTFTYNAQGIVTRIIIANDNS